MGEAVDSLLDPSSNEKTKKTSVERRLGMFGRKKRHIRFLTLENEILRKKMEMAERYAGTLANGDILKAVLLHPDSIRDNQIVITQKELADTSRYQLIMVQHISGDRLIVRLRCGDE